jgi:hypothetical protein
MQPLALSYTHDDDEESTCGVREVVPTSGGYRSSASHPKCVLGVLLVALLVSFLVVGCGGGDDSASATTDEAEAATATEASEPEQDPADFLEEV